MTEMARANSLVIIEQGDSKQQPQRPTSAGRISINKVPFKRSGSSLEIIPPEPDEDGDSKILTATINNNECPPSHPSSSRASLNRTSSPAGQSTKKRPSSRKSSSSTKDRPPSGTKDRPPSRSSSKTLLQHSASQENVRNSPDAGSSGKKSDGSVAVSNNVHKVHTESDVRISSAEARIERCGMPKKQVYLPSVRRNYEQHGMPKDDTLDTILRESLSSPIEQASCSNHSNSHHGDKGTQENIDALLERLSMRVDGNKLEVDEDDRKGSGGKKKTKSQSKPSTLETANKEKPKPSSNDELADTDAYYTSPGIILHDEESKPSTAIVSDAPTSKIASQMSVPVPASTDPYYISHGAESNKEDVQAEADSDEENSSDEEESDEEKDEGPKAPIELLGEFVEAVMDEEWEDAEKLCKMVLMYEPDNAEAKQFQPLIEEMLRRECHEQLYGSDSDEEESSDETDSDDEDEDEESSSTESESDATSDDEEEMVDVSKKESEKMEREAKMIAAMKNTTTDDHR